MSRILIVTLFCLFTNSLWQALALFFPNIVNVLFLPPIILVFCLQYFRQFETVVIVLWCGAIVDILGGSLIGFNMLLMLLFFFLLSASSIFAGRLSLRELSAYVAVISLFYRVAFFLIEATFSWQSTNLYLAHLCFGPLVDWLISIPFYALMMRVLIAIKAFEPAERSRGLGTVT
jgi:hypothetical protein